MAVEMHLYMVGEVWFLLQGRGIFETYFSPQRERDLQRKGGRERSPFVLYWWANPTIKDAFPLIYHFIPLIITNIVNWQIQMLIWVYFQSSLDGRLQHIPCRWYKKENQWKKLRSAIDKWLLNSKLVCLSLSFFFLRKPTLKQYERVGKGARILV